MRVLISCLLLSLCLAVTMASDKIFPYPYFIDDLPNGLRLITIPTDYPNLVAFWVIVQVGSRNEVEPGKSGFAHFFEHMMFRGTEKYSNEKYNELLKNAGADANAYTSNDYTAYHITHPKEDLELMVMLEADRFQNLQYSLEGFKTESKAVLGEYNKNSTNPITKMFEVSRNRAFDKHTYKHTTMGFLKDIEDMPNQYDYSRQFFSRFYRPEYTTILVVGSVKREETLSLVQKYWSNWKRGSFGTKVPDEPNQTAPRTDHVDWPIETSPWVMVAFKGPAYSDEVKDMPTADIISTIAFSESGELYQKLVIQEQKVDQLFPLFPDSRDPYLLSLAARVKDKKDMAYVQEELLKAFEAVKTRAVPAQRLEGVKSHLKYSVSLRMDSSEGIAEILANYVQLRRTPESLNKLFQLYDAVSVEDVREIAKNISFPQDGLLSR